MSFALDKEGKVYSWGQAEKTICLNDIEGSALKDINIKFTCVARDILMLDSERNLYSYKYNEEENKIELSSIDVVKNKKISSIIYRWDGNILMEDTDGIIYIYAYETNFKFESLNTEESQIFKNINNFEDEEGIMFITDTEDIYYIFYRYNILS